MFKSNRDLSKIDVDRIEILAAGAGRRFIEAGYEVSKPFLPVGEIFLGLQAMDALGLPSHSKGILLQKSQLNSTQHIELLKSNLIEIREVRELTKGQAESALISLKSGSGGNCIVGTCDSLIFPDNKNLMLMRGKSIGVWVTKPSDFAINNPTQFGWVNLDDAGSISESWIKEEPSSPQEKYVITGTFYFGDVVSSIELLKEFLAQGNTVKGEYYLDSLLQFAKQSGWEIFGLIPERFISLGTPDEYETYIYWENLFIQRPDLLVEDDV